MITFERFPRGRGLLLLSLVLFSACTEKEYRDRILGSANTRDAGTKSDAGSASDAGDGTADGPACPPVVASDKLPPRLSVLSSTSKPTQAGVFTGQLFGLFVSHCGACHVSQGQGKLQVTLQDFPEKVTDEALERIRTDDPKLFMPPLPKGKPYSERPAGDALVEFANLLEAWLLAGSPADVFYPPSEGSSGGNLPFALTRDVGMAMTNMGNCVPAARMISREEEVSAKLDAMFETATALPDRLEQTDMISLDSEVLARHGVIAFAPTYTLWADEAKKIRMLRLPRGTSLKFDAAAQRFDVPTNTRVYKTFLKKVYDHRGVEGYRKMETRVIVSKPDEKQADGSFKTKSLFGTYVWNEAETEAILLKDPLRNGEPFRDRMITYITNEQAADAVIAKGPKNLQQELEKLELTRTYAVPGSERCVHCHMGSENQSFLLGLTPLQMNRRPMGEGGVIEPAERDELNQLQRFIDYGIVTGMSSPSEVVLLEDSQGERKPRNEHELAAQGYMLGNCSHCHNPTGFPSVREGVLRDTLNFFPSPEGGIFQFPLDKVSPRIRRGENLRHAIPYISPGLYDIPKPEGIRHPEAKILGKSPCLPVVNVDNQTITDPDSCYSELLAPWRSLIYRNVDAPFSYAEDSTIFPHMPMDTAGYDCRARQLLGSWMVSIVVDWKYRTVQKTRQGSIVPAYFTEFEYSPPESDDPLPYSEIFADQPGYRSAEFAMQRRLRLFQESSRYNDCPPSTLDIVDPKVVRGELTVPKDSRAFPKRDSVGEPVLNPDGTAAAVYSLQVPERPHWFDTDLTEAAADWYPRRGDWKGILEAPPVAGKPIPGTQAHVIQLLQDVRVTPEFKTFALTNQAFGYWIKKDGCDFTGQEKASAFTGEKRPEWFTKKPPQGDEPIYQVSPGSMVFNAICANCHGPVADSKGIQADRIAEFTGGRLRVANLRDGLFGPPGLWGSNIDKEFAVATGVPPVTSDKKPVTAQDRAARYMLWMGLGGTQQAIPPPVLGLVNAGKVLDEKRSAVVAVTDANMLNLAVGLCKNVAERPTGREFYMETGGTDFQGSPLVTSNGDSEVWQELCGFNNPLPVLRVAANFHTQDVRSRSDYPVNALVGDPRLGVATGVKPDNPAPWCIIKPDKAELVAEVEARFNGKPIPYCPEEISKLPEDDRLITEFGLRGAMNAGLSVFLYLQALTRGELQPSIAYDRCELLKAP